MSENDENMVSNWRWYRRAGLTYSLAETETKAEEEEGREQTAKKHAEAAENKEQAAKDNEAKKSKQKNN